MKTAVKEFHLHMLKIALLFALSLAALFGIIAGISFASSNDGSFSTVMIILLLFLVILVFVIFELVTLLVIAGFKKTIRKQEEANGCSLQEQWDQGATDLGKGFYLTKDWVVSTHGPAMAFHKNSIDDCSVQKDFIQGKEVNTYTVFSNGASFQMRLVEKNLGENLSIANKWFNKRREELSAINGESELLEGECVSEPVEERIPITNRPPKDPNSTKKFLAIAGFAVAMLVLLLITSVVSGKINSRKEIKQISKQSQYDTFDEYADYLKEAAGDSNRIEFYLDEYKEDAEYVITIKNPTNLFYFCDLLLDSYDADSDILVFARPKRNEYYYRQFTDVPDTYEIKNDNFYEFTYPDAGFKYTIEDDGDSEGYIWENVIIPEENLNLEDISKLAERLYAECVLTDIWYEVYYVFGDNVEKVEYDGYYYYDLTTSTYGFVIDLENKQIVFYELLDNSFVECMTVEMK